jgi:dihydroorotate dehydrogenase
LPRDFPAHVRETYGIDLTARFLGQDIPHPIGKGSGQLSLNQGQLEDDAAAGLAFVVLKTVIAESPSGERSMGAWAIHETRMKVERRVGVSNREGWTVTWKGRGWDKSLDDYLALIRAGRDLTRAGAMLVVPSVKYHLPGAHESFNEREYDHTTKALAGAWGDPAPLLLEKDFSPTLAGDPRSTDQDAILRWLREVPARIRAASPMPVRLALKLMNARFDDDFQLEMMQIAAAADADGLVCFNRLFDPATGVAYGGWDLSDRNLRVLDLFSRTPGSRPGSGAQLTPGASRGLSRTASLIGTGNIGSGSMVLEYARRGCESVELHTFFQLPLSAYHATRGTRAQRALHALIFHPADGLIHGLLALAEAGALERRGGEIHFLDVSARAH